jgi:hypothetical protein
MEKTEELRQNWHITEMQHNWANRRRIAKKNAADLIAHHKAEKEKQIKLLNEEHEARKEAIEADFKAKVVQVEEGLNTTLLQVAIEQDEYMHRFRNYVASLPKDEQAAYDMHRE